MSIDSAAYRLSLLGKVIMRNTFLISLRIMVSVLRVMISTSVAISDETYEIFSVLVFCGSDLRIIPALNFSALISIRQLLNSKEVSIDCWVFNGIYSGLDSCDVGFILLVLDFCNFYVFWKCIRFLWI